MKSISLLVKVGKGAPVIIINDYSAMLLHLNYSPINLHSQQIEYTMVSHRPSSQR